MVLLYIYTKITHRNLIIDQHEIDKAVEPERLTNERQISAALSQASVDAFRQVFRDIQSLAYEYARHDNTLISMLKLEAREIYRK